MSVGRKTIFARCLLNPCYFRKLVQDVDKHELSLKSKNIPSQCTSVYVYVCKSMSERERERERQNESGSERDSVMLSHSSLYTPFFSPVSSSFFISILSFRVALRFSLLFRQSRLSSSCHIEQPRTFLSPSNELSITDMPGHLIIMFAVH